MADRSITFRLTNAQIAFIDRWAMRENRSRSDVVRMLIDKLGPLDFDSILMTPTPTSPEDPHGP